MNVCSFYWRISIHLAHFLDEPKSHNTDALDFIDHSRILIRGVVYGFLFLSIVVFLFKFLKPNLKQLNKRRFWLSYLSLLNFYHNYSKKSHLLTKLNFIMISYSLFLLICINLITSNIKTNELILDTSNIIDSMTKLLATKRYLHICPFY